MRTSHMFLAAAVVMSGMPGCTRQTAPPPPEEAAEAGRAFEFALLGDNPYLPEAVPLFENLIDDVNRNASLQWVIHVGDILRPQVTTCDDDVVLGRFALYQRFAMPFVFTPGDNDWFDCNREEAGGYDEYERLGFLRRLFFPVPGTTTGGRTMEVRTQADMAGYEDFVENVLWSHNGVTFATVHALVLTREPTDPAVAERRTDAAVAWIQEAFRVAAEEDSAGVFIATQADLWLASGPRGLVNRCPDCFAPRAGLERLYPVLEEQSVAYGRPVVVAVGDTHVFRVDKPLYSSDTGLLVENVTRVEPFGHPYVHWVRVGVDPDDDDVFSFSEELVDENVGAARDLVATGGA